MDDAENGSHHTKLESNGTVHLNHAMEHMSLRLPFGVSRQREMTLGGEMGELKTEMCEAHIGLP
jgi:hypothetical protein